MEKINYTDEFLLTCSKEKLIWYIRKLEEELDA